MASSVKQAIKKAGEALLEKILKKLLEIHDIEKQINLAHIAIDDHCLKLLATQQPFAADLRLIVAIIKINTDLERMGDQAVNIAHNVEMYMKDLPLKPLIDLPQMFSEVKKMVKESLDSFVKKDEPMARLVLKHDDIVDSLKNKIFKDVLEHIKLQPATIQQGLSSS